MFVLRMLYEKSSFAFMIFFLLFSTTVHQAMSFTLGLLPKDHMSESSSVLPRFSLHSCLTLQQQTWHPQSRPVAFLHMAASYLKSLKGQELQCKLNCVSNCQCISFPTLFLRFQHCMLSSVK